MNVVRMAINAHPISKTTCNLSEEDFANMFKTLEYVEKENLYKRDVREITLEHLKTTQELLTQNTTRFLIPKDGNGTFRDDTQPYQSIVFREDMSVLNVRKYWSEEEIKTFPEIQRLITSKIPADQWPKMLEDQLNKIAYVPPNGKDVLKLMNEFWQDVQANKVSPAGIHLKITQIHPFMYGNGRTARLWMNIFRIRNGLSPVYEVNEEPYMDACRQNTEEALVDFFRNSCVA